MVRIQLFYLPNTEQKIKSGIRGRLRVSNDTDNNQSQKTSSLNQSQILSQYEKENQSQDQSYSKN